MYEGGHVRQMRQGGDRRGDSKVDDGRRQLKMLNFSSLKVDSDIPRVAKKKKENLQKEIDSLREYVSSLDMIAVCYHGMGRSLDLVSDLQKQPLRSLIHKKTLKIDHTGIQRLYSQLSPSDADTRTREDESRLFNFAEELADILLSAREVVLFTGKKEPQNFFEKALYAALVRKGERKGNLLDMNRSDVSLPQVISALNSPQ